MVQILIVMLRSIVASQVGFAMFSALQSDKAPNAWGKKMIAVNPTGLRWNVDHITAGNTAVELLILMNAIRPGCDLANLRWGAEILIKDECKDWCVACNRWCAASFVSLPPCEGGYSSVL